MYFHLLNLAVYIIFLGFLTITTIKLMEVDFEGVYEMPAVANNVSDKIDDQAYTQSRDIKPEDIEISHVRKFPLKLKLEL